MIPTKARNRSQKAKEALEPVTAEEFFSRLDPLLRQRLYQHFQKYVWDYAKASRTPWNSNGARVLPPMPTAVGSDIEAAALDVFSPPRTTNRPSKWGPK